MELSRSIRHLYRQNIVPYKWPQWSVVNAVGAQLARSWRAVEGIWQLDRLAYVVIFLTRSLRVAYAQPTRNLQPQLYLEPSTSFILIVYFR